MIRLNQKFREGPFQARQLAMQRPRALRPCDTHPYATLAKRDIDDLSLGTNFKYLRNKGGFFLLCAVFEKNVVGEIFLVILQYLKS